ncbi:hypothetical protein ABZW03_02750 [Kitasatospora sp. NPDC004799]
MFQRCRMPAPASPAARAAVPVQIPTQIPAALATHEAGRAFA